MSPPDFPAPRQKQLLLDIGPDEAPPTLDNFIVGQNHELLARLRPLGKADVFDQIYLWGPPGCGRTHLLRAAHHSAQTRARPVCFFDGSELETELVPQPGALVIIDNVESLNEIAQITLFRVFNAARLVGLSLLLSGQSPPLQLQPALREDLRTRIGSTLIFEVRPLADADKAQALHQRASQRGMRIDDGLIDYLLHHGRRDLPSLLNTLDQLDQASLEQKRPPTLPLLREVLQLTLDLAHINQDNHESGLV
jgi:DnaA family protein